jgi:hypothetical protein
MEIRSGNQTILEPNATVRMTDGDHLSIAFTDLGGRTVLVNVSATKFAMLVREQRSNDVYSIEPGPLGNTLFKA